MIEKIEGVRIEKIETREEKIERYRKKLNLAEQKLTSLIIDLTQYLKPQEVDRHKQVTQAVAISHFSRQIAYTEGIIADLKRELDEVIAETAQRAPKRTIEDLDIERRDSRKKTRPSYFS